MGVLCWNPNGFKAIGVCFVLNATLNTAPPSLAG